MASNLRDFQKRRAISASDIHRLVPLPFAAGVTLVDYGYGPYHVTKLTLAGVTVGTTSDGNSLGFGVQLLTLPPGELVVRSARCAVGLTSADDTKTDTPELGLGTTVAAGAVAVLGGTAAFENIMIGTAVADVNGTVLNARVKPQTSPFELAIAASGGLNHAVYLNVADAWDAGDDDAVLTAAGEVWLEWIEL